MEEYGIDKLKEVFRTGILAGIKIEDALDEDSPKGKKISLLQEGVPLFMYLLPNVIAHIGDAELIKQQWKDVSQVEIDELKQYLIDELDLDDDVVEDLIEAFIIWLDATNDFRLAIQALVRRRAE